MGFLSLPNKKSTMLKILIAPNAFKGSLTALEATSAIAGGFRKSKLPCELIEVPVADGGDGSLEVIAEHLGATLMTARVNNPVGAVIDARYGFIEEEKVAIIEMAEASGIRLIKKEQLNPWRLTSYGAGQLMLQAVTQGAKHIYLTLGGSATVDGAIGLLDALGVVFVNARGVKMERINMSNLHEVTHLEANSALQLLAEVKLTILSDVTNPLLGENGAASVFGPQKGLQEKDITSMDRLLKHLARLIFEVNGVAIDTVQGGGAAGGIAATLFGLFDATIISGGEQILTWSQFDKKLETADLVITAEGKIDAQTAYGKGPGLVALKAKERGVPVIGICGSVNADQLEVENFDAIFPITHSPVELAEALTFTPQNIERTACQIGNLLSATGFLKKS